MGSKTLSPSKPSRDEPCEDSASRLLAEDIASKYRLLDRIADALQVPQAALYNLPNAVSSARRRLEEVGASAEDLDRDGAALLHAFKRIHDPKKRRCLLGLVQAAADFT